MNGSVRRVCRIAEYLCFFQDFVVWYAPPARHGRAPNPKDAQVSVSDRINGACLASILHFPYICSLLSSAELRPERL